MRCLAAGCILAAAVLVSIAPAGAQDVGEWDARAVERAVEKAKAFMWSQWSDGHWKEFAKPGPGKGQAANYGGVTALCTYALLAAGESPQEARMKKTLKWLSEIEMYGTYARALRANVWGMLGRNNPYRRKLAEDVKRLVYGAGGDGAYTYIIAERPKHRVRRLADLPKGGYDNSNSQLGVLGVWAGRRSGIEVLKEYWELVEKHWTKTQNSDGGWAYYGARRGVEAPSYGSMTAAGLATMFICFDALYSREFVKCRANTDYPPIVRGLAWMDKNFTANTNPYPARKGSRGHYYYYLYGVERVGLASGYKYFGKKDWYKLGALKLLEWQQKDGGWRRNVIQTSFALLFLARGQHPVLFNKLKYPGSWNSRPRDLANLTRWITRTFEKQVNWQIIHLGVPVSEWHDAPILYVSGSTAPKFSDEELNSLRDFVLQGGVIFSEAACSRPAFSMAMQRYYAKMFPKYELKRLGRDHPIYDVHYKIGRRGLLGISNGVRLLAIHSPAQVSLAWQLNRYATQADVFHVGANVYFYVSDKGSLRKRGVSPWPKARTFNAAQTLKVAVVKYSGNFEPEPLAWKRFAILMGNRHSIALEISGPTALTDLDASRQPVAAMTGTTAFTLADEERDALRKYLDNGGVLIADAAGGSKAFTTAAEKEFAKVLPEAKYGLISVKHAIYSKTGQAIEKVSYRRAAGGRSGRPRLRGFSHRGRLAIIFSRDDLTAGLLGYPCWGLAGYAPDSAFELMRNIVLYASGKTLQ